MLSQKLFYRIVVATFQLALAYPAGHRPLFSHSQQGLTAALLLQSFVRRATTRSVPDLLAFSRALDNLLDLAARFLT